MASDRVEEGGVYLEDDWDEEWEVVLNTCQYTERVFPSLYTSNYSTHWEVVY